MKVCLHTSKASQISIQFDEIFEIHFSDKKSKNREKIHFFLNYSLARVSKVLKQASLKFAKNYPTLPNFSELWNLEVF